MWQIEAVGNVEHIYIAENPYFLLCDLKPAMISYMDNIFDEHWEDINCSDLEDLHEQFGDEEYQGEWGASNVKELIVNLLDDKLIELERIRSEKSFLGDWYALLNDVQEFWTWQDNDYLYIPVEGQTKEFAEQLSKDLEFSYTKHGAIRLSDSRWLVHLRRLVSRPSWWKDQESLRRLRRLIDEFNDNCMFS